MDERAVELRRLAEEQAALLASRKQAARGTWGASPSFSGNRISEVEGVMLCLLSIRLVAIPGARLHPTTLLLTTLDLLGERRRRLMAV